ncbi:MAG: methyl-accepting chemotaxis protein [Clostridia bacterium]|nr:methyl-accepting chemotaxis protein [Clostridia bacterium]
MKNKMLGVRIKVLVPFVIVMVLLSSTTIMNTKKSFSSATYSRIEEKLDSDINYIEDMLRLTYGPEWSVKDGFIYKGETALGDGSLENSVNGVFDEHLKDTGTFSLVFMREYGVEDDLKFIESKGYTEGHYLRVAGSTKDAKGNRIIGTRISKPVADAIEEKGIFKGEANVAGNFIYCKYVPLKNSKNEIVGTMVVGVNTNSVHDLIADMSFKVNGLMLIFVTLGTIILWLTTNQIKNSIDKVIVKLRKVKAGDLTDSSDMVTHDEIELVNRNLNESNEEIKKLILKIKDSNTSIDSAAKDINNSIDDNLEAFKIISKSSDEINEKIEKQSNETQSSVELMENLAGDVDSINTATDVLNDKVESSNVKIEDGIKKMESLNKYSTDNLEGANNISKSIMDIDKSSKQITEITDTISSIAEQTNLLSLNASIEAARAGEHGRGFAVVADEVRKLAEESSAASEKVKKLIDEMQEKSKYAVNEVDNTMKIAEDTTSSVKEAREVFEEIVEYNKEIYGSLEGIRDSLNSIVGNKDALYNFLQLILKLSEESTDSIKVISKSMDDRTMGMEELKSLSNNLKEVVNVLTTNIERFKLK